MFKEKINKTKEYVKEHKVEISLVIGAVSLTGLSIVGYKYHDLKNELNTVKEVARNSLDREFQRNEYEINKLRKSISQLKDSNINKFDRIPKKESRIFELTLYNKDILEEKSKL